VRETTSQASAIRGILRGELVSIFVDLHNYVDKYGSLGSASTLKNPKKKVNYSL
jgi:hypothetical protein